MGPEIISIEGDIVWTEDDLPDAGRFFGLDKHNKECFGVESPSMEGDVYSVAMTSFSVCTPFGTISLLYTIILLQSGHHRGISV